MSKLISLLVAEFEKEAATTRKMLARIPEDKYDWQPHDKSMTLRRLAVHVAEIPSWVSLALTTDELDFSNNTWQPDPVENNEQLLAFFDRSFERGLSDLKNADENKFDELWTLRNGDTVYSSEPKYDVIRMSFCQTVHHRAQLGVFLRLLNVPIPGSYGPSADEPAF